MPEKKRPIRFTCPSCQATLAVPREKAGLKARCRNCNEVTTVPVPKRKRRQKTTPSYFEDAPAEKTEQPAGRPGHYAAALKSGPVALLVKLIPVLLLAAAGYFLYATVFGAMETQEAYTLLANGKLEEGLTRLGTAPGTTPEDKRRYRQAVLALKRALPAKASRLKRFAQSAPDRPADCAVALEPQPGLTLTVTRCAWGKRQHGATFGTPVWLNFEVVNGSREAVTISPRFLMLEGGGVRWGKDVADAGETLEAELPAGKALRGSVMFNYFEWQPQRLSFFDGSLLVTAPVRNPEIAERYRRTASGFPDQEGEKVYPMRVPWQERIFTPKKDPKTK